MHWSAHLLITALIVLTTATTNAQYFEEDLLSCSPDKVDYEWQRQNYYELLGFSSPGKKGKTSQIESKDIRKHYRMQAQIWHPDKMKANETLPIEEINTRFAQIAQAYQTLNDAPKRQAYDRFLENCEYMRGRGGHSNRHSASGGQSNSGSRGQPSYSHQSNSNPYRQGPQSQQNSNYGYGQGRYYQEQQETFQQRPTPPSSVRKERAMLVDPMTGAPILRETTYEEYQDDNYYRVYVEDYLVESMDAWGNSYYQPLYPHPMVVKEGQLHEPPTDTLSSGDVLRMEQVLMSSNERYRARILNCQLVIETRESSSAKEVFDPEVDIVWKSNNHAQYATAECFLGFEQGQLLLAGGSPEFHSGDILWRSSVDDGDNDEDYSGFGYGGSLNNYIARLENDGKLVVYQVDMSSFDAEDDSPGRCVYATGPLGCTRFASKMFHFARAARDHVGSFFDSNAESDSEEDEEDDLLAKSLRIGKNALEILNRERKKVEKSLEERSLKFVQDGILRLQERRQRISR